MLEWLMTARNLADPSYEPTDAEHVELMQAAFSGVAEAKQRRLREMRRVIAEGQAQIRAHWLAVLADGK